MIDPVLPQRWNRETNLKRYRGSLRKARSWTMFAAGAISLPCSMTWAQAAGPGSATPGAGASDDMTEIVVTALRRDTPLQQTPLSVSAVSADALSQTGAVDFIDFAASVPGFTILDDGPGQRRPIIRGIEGAGEATVGIYYDEFPITSTPGATNDAGRFTPDIKLVDVQQVAVLRGPQGTLFGAGSEGGTLQTTFNKPDLRNFSGSVSTDVGEVSHGTQNVDTNGVVNLPLVDGVLAARLVGYHINQSGFVQNETLGVADINQGYANGARIAVRYQPTDHLTFDLLILYHQAHYDAGNETTVSLGKYQSDVPAYDPENDQIHLYGLTARYNFDFATLVADASYFRRDFLYNFVFAGLPIPWGYAGAQGLTPYMAGEPTVGNALVEQPQDTGAETFEVRLNAPNPATALQWTVGGFFQNRNASAGSNIPYVSADGQVDPAYPLFQARTILSSLDQRAGYADVSYDFFDKLTVTAAGRYEDFTATQSTGYAIDLGGDPTPNASDTGAYSGRSFSDRKFIKKFNVAYQFTDTLMGYATYSEGFRAGGANQAVVNEPTVPAGYGPDTVKNYEAGFKSEWFGKRLLINADYYRMDWDNIQVQGETPDGLYRFTTNAGFAKVNGVEVEAHVRAMQGLDFGATYGWTFARLTADYPVDPGVTESGYAGDRLAYVPRQQFNLSGDYTYPLWSDYSLRLYTDYQYVGPTQNLPSPYLADATTGAPSTTLDPGFVAIGGYSTVNARISLRSDRWTVGIYGNNLGNKLAVTNVNWDPPFTPGKYTYTNTPRVIGLSISAKF